MKKLWKTMKEVQQKHDSVSNLNLKKKLYMILVKAMNLSTPICTKESDTKGSSGYTSLSCILNYLLILESI